MIELSPENKPRKELKNREKIDRIPLSQKSSIIIKKTLETLIEKHPGVVINKNGFVNWLIEEHFGGMTSSTEKQLFDKFYDEIKFLEKSLKDLKQKKKNGEDISIAKVLKQAKPRFRKATEKPKEDLVKTTEAAPKKPAPEKLSNINA